MADKPLESRQWLERCASIQQEAAPRLTLSIFLLLLVVIFSLQRMGFGPGPAEGVEQWVNLTNQMFYGRQDFLFSYGPAYWITGEAAAQYSASTFWVAVLASTLIYATFWTLLFTLAYRSGTYLFFAIGYFLFFYSLIFPSAWYLWPLAVLAYLEFSCSRPVVLGARTLTLLGCLVGLAFFVRYFYGLIALLALGSYFFSASIARGRLLSFAPFVLGVAIGYVLCGFLIFHRWSSLLAYIVINNQLNFGNSIDMALDFANPVKHLVAAAVSMLAISLYALARRRVLFLTLCGLSVIFVKMGFSRIDHYIGYFVVPMAVLGLLLLFDGSRTGRVLFVVVAGCLHYMQSHPVFPNAPTRAAFQSSDGLTGDYADRMQQLYAAYKLDPAVTARIGSSTIDVYPYNNEYLFANKLNYWRRPMFQNYMTLTPKLDAMNEQFFQSKDRPRFVLWTAGVGCRSESCNVFEAFDDKFSLNEDPLTSSAILMNYHVVAVTKGRHDVPVALLEEDDTVKPYTSHPLRRESMQFGQWYKVPPVGTGVIKLVPEFKLTLAGRLKSALFHGGVVRVNYRLLTGEVLSYRLNILNAASGVWVSPLPSGFDLAGPKVDAVMMETRTPGYFAPNFEASWERVPITAIQTSKPNYDAEVSLADEANDKREANCDGAIDSINNVEPGSATISEPNSMLVQGWLAQSAANGARFDRILVTLTDGSGHARFWSTRTLDRPDVAQVFRHPALATAGFRGTLDTSALKGVYKLGLAGVSGSMLVLCHLSTPAPLVDMGQGEQ